ncbi:hypothetical protein A0H81_06158 [Grifola frondosa]|uniref:Uncharacterized protein n=1 Tax=Grifola frondosa TaxID=5627 RepID=A0A1C7MAU8_GRIFR|nr:hypothetical protein A0H81_06158 [Grifola frondosa]
MHGVFETCPTGRFRARVIWAVKLDSCGSKAGGCSKAPRNTCRAGVEERWYPFYRCWVPGCDQGADWGRAPRSRRGERSHDSGSVTHTGQQQQQQQLDTFLRNILHRDRGLGSQVPSSSSCQLLPAASCFPLPAASRHPFILPPPATLGHSASVSSPPPSPPHSLSDVPPSLCPYRVPHRASSTCGAVRDGQRARTTVPRPSPWFFREGDEAGRIRAQYKRTHI